MQILNLSATINVASLEPSINTYRLGEGAGTYEYPELNNKPKINGVTLVGDISSANLGIKTSDLTNDSGFISEADIPTATSDLVNDSGFVNSTQVQSVVSDAIPSDISYFNNDVGYITDADIGNIPTRTSQLVNDSGYITATEAPVVSVNNITGAVVLDGSNIEYEQSVSLNAKIDAVEGSIPTQTSQLTNDSGYITKANIPTRTSQLVNDSGFVNAQNVPVKSVNAKTGAVELTADDIDYDNDNTVAAKIDAVEGSIPTRTSQLVNDSGFVNAQNIAQTGTIEGVEVASFSDGADNVPVSELIVDIEAEQDLHGYDKPWAGGAGKNKLPNTASTSTIDGVTFKVNDDGSITASGTSTGWTGFTVGTCTLPAGTYKVSSGIINGGYYYYEARINNVNYNTAYEPVSLPFTLEEPTEVTVKAYAAPNYQINNVTGYPMIIIESESDLTYEPYSNICPITGFDSGVITVTDNDQATNNYTVDFDRTVYGGYFDNRGNLVVTHGYIASYNGETINEPWISSMDNYAPNTSPSTGAQVVYPLTTPTTLTITSKKVKTLLGNNNIFVNTGNIRRLEYFKTGCENIAKLIEAMI